MSNGREVGSLPLLALYLALSLCLLAFTFATVHSRPADELTRNSNAQRSHTELTRWIDEGYWHFAGLLVLSSRDQPPEVYRSSTGGYLLTGYFVEKLFHAFSGRYSWRLLAIHNEFIAAVTAALLGLLGFRLGRRLGLPVLFAFLCGAALQGVHFTFPDNLSLYWEMTAQAMWLLFAVLFFLLEERGDRRGRTPRQTVAQAACVFAMVYMEFVLGVAFVVSFVLTSLVLRNDGREWRRFALVAALPAICALVIFKGQLATAGARFGEPAISGTPPLARSGLDGDVRYYTTHLDIAFGRDVPRRNFQYNRALLFTWTWLFFLGTASLLAGMVAFARGRAPSLIAVTLVTLAGAWVVLAAVFSQAVVIHPYLYDVVLATPLMLALFVALPALIEPMVNRTGVAVLIVVFCAIWYSFYQMRLYALRDPLPLAAAVYSPVQLRVERWSQIDLVAAFVERPGPGADVDGPGRRVLHDDSAGADQRVFADRDGIAQRGIDTDKTVRLDVDVARDDDVGADEAVIVDR